MPEVVRRCLVLFVALAIIGGPASRLARGLDDGVTMSGMPCSMSMQQASMSDGHAMPMAACRTMTGDCLKQMGCVADVALPARFPTLCWITGYTQIAYWAAGSGLHGLVRRPDPFPPRTT